MKEMLVHDSEGRVYEMSDCLLREMPAAGQPTTRYIMKDAIRRVFAGDSRTRIIKNHGGGPQVRYRVTEYTNGELLIGCRRFDRMTACVIRGWAYE
jgi:hypothetical protein